MNEEAITMQENEDSKMHHVRIGGNYFVGYGFEWKDFAQAHDIVVGDKVVFTLVSRC